eukprot:1724483-Lingulodinium_polyedra.AAC.1
MTGTVATATSIGALMTLRRVCRGKNAIPTHDPLSSNDSGRSSPKGGGEANDSDEGNSRVFIVGASRVKNKYHTRTKCPTVL